MPMVRAMRVLNALEAGTLDGAGLDALFAADPSTIGEFNVLLGMRGQAGRIAASGTTLAAVIASPTALAAVIDSPTAMTAVAASSTAMAAVIANPAVLATVIASSTAMAAVIASSTAMAAVAASSTAMAAVIASSTVMAAVAASPAAVAAIWASDTALGAIEAGESTMDALINSALVTQLAGYCLSTGSDLRVNGLTAMGASEKYLIVGLSTETVDATRTMTISGRRAGSTHGVLTFPMDVPADCGGSFEPLSTIHPLVLAKPSAKKLYATEGAVRVSTSGGVNRYMNFLAIPIS